MQPAYWHIEIYLQQRTTLKSHPFSLLANNNISAFYVAWELEGVAILAVFFLVFFGVQAQ